MANVLIIEAERYIDWAADLPESPTYDECVRAGDRTRFNSWEEGEQCVQRAIDAARGIINSHIGVVNVVVTACGSLMAMVRWNLEIDADPPIEVARFREPLVLC